MTTSLTTDIKRGLKSKQAGHLQKAENIFRKLLEQSPEDPRARHHLGNTLIAEGNLEAGIRELETALASTPDNGLVAYNLGFALFLTQRFRKALTALTCAVILEPNLLDAKINRGSCFHALGRFEEALEEFDKAIALKPDDADSHWNRSLTLLTMGRYREGFKEYEWRWQRPAKINTYPHHFKQPHWQGKPFRNKRLLVFSEQGLGDTLQFIRFLPMVKKLGGQLIFELRQELANMLAELEGPDEITIFSQERPYKIDCDLQIPLMSLPQVLGIEIDRLPKPATIALDQKKNEFWRKKLTPEKINIGLVWAGQPSHANDKHRSLPLNAFKELFELKNINVYSLQIGPASRQTDEFIDSEFFFNAAPHIKDFTDSAALINNLDLIISVDTAVAHLAATLNRPTWILLSYVPDWRWQREKTKSPWYPSVTLWRQSSPGTWQDVISKLTKKIKNCPTQA